MSNQKASGAGKDWSANAVSNPPPGNFLLSTIPPNRARAGFLIQNNDAVDTAWAVFDNTLEGAAAGTATVYAMAPASVANGQGGGISWQSQPHAGRIRIYGATVATKVAAREW